MKQYTVTIQHKLTGQQVLVATGSLHATLDLKQLFMGAGTGAFTCCIQGADLIEITT
jgi:hypothetical protein